MEHAASFVALGTPTESYPLPEPSRVRFYLVTPQGVVSAEGPTDDFENRRHEFARLYYHAQTIINALRLVQGTPAQDYAAARVALAASEDYLPYRYTLLQPQLISAHRQLAQDPESPPNAAIAPLLQLLSEYPLSIQGHYALAAAIRAMADEQESPEQASSFVVESARLRTTADAILASIIESRDGSSPDDAFVVINQVEEYAVMESLRLRPGTQSVGEIEGVYYDVWRVTDEFGEGREIYFDISLFVPPD